MDWLEVPWAPPGSLRADVPLATVASLDWPGLDRALTGRGPADVRGEGREPGTERGEGDRDEPCREFAIRRGPAA